MDSDFQVRAGTARSRLLAFAGFVIVVAGCSSSPSASAPVEGATGGPNATATAAPNATATAARQFTYGADQPVNTLDPHLTSGGSAENSAIMLLYDRLVHLDANRKIWPQLAESWTVTPNSATFVLKQGPTCSDGTPITPQVVAASLERMGADTTAGPFKAASVGKDGYEVTTNDSQRTVTVTTKKPFGDLLVGMAMPWASIICPAGLKDPGALATAAFGSGAYTLVSNSSGTLTFAARPEYNWGPQGFSTQQASVPQTIYLKAGMDNRTTAAGSLGRGELDAFLFDSIDRARFDKNDNFTRLDVPTPGSSYLGFKHDGVLADQDVRQGIFMGIDPAAANQARYQGYGVANTTVVGKLSDCWDAGTAGLQTYDVEGGKKLLDQTGWIAGADGVRSKDGQRLIIRYAGAEEDGGLNDYMLEALKTMGAEVKMQVLEKTSWLSLTRNDLGFDMALQPNGGSMYTPSQAFSAVTGKNTPDGPNVFHVADPALDEAVAAARTSVGDERCGLWATAQRILVQNYHVLPFASASKSWIVKKPIHLDGLGQYFDPYTLSV